MEDFKFGNKVHVFSDLDLLSTKQSAKEFLDETIPKLPAKIGHFKAILPIDEESNFNGEAFYNGILLEFNKMIPENNYYITAKSLY